MFMKLNTKWKHMHQWKHIALHQSALKERGPEIMVGKEKEDDGDDDDDGSDD